VVNSAAGAELASGIVPPAHDAVFDNLPQGPAASLAATVCIPPIGTDGVNQAFCSSKGPPPITGLKDLEAVMGLGFTNANGGNGTGGNPSFVLIGHSSSLVGHYVSSINPRAIVFTPGLKAGSNTSFTAIGYTRGEEFAEILTSDGSGQTNAYVLHFEKACDLTHSCTWADLLTPEAEQGWVNYSLYEDDNPGDLVGDTIMDCQQCHQPQGPGQNVLLRMQEFTAPFTHFMSAQTEGGKALLTDFHAAHGTSEDYAGIPAALIDQSDPSLLAAFITAAGAPAQANAFPSATIEAEVKASDPLQPSDNSVPGTSATWQGLYGGFVQGLFIPPPYHDVKITDATKLAAMTQAYQDFMAGRIAASELPDIRRVLPDNPKVLSDLGFHVQQGFTDGKSILINACTQCHNSNLDQTQSRARFNVQNVAQMSKSELSIAIGRVSQAPNSLFLMPPARFRELLPAEKQLVVDYLNSLIPAAP
jgi:hypothetical protein